jgi:hypothetical protein
MTGGPPFSSTVSKLASLSRTLHTTALSRGWRASESGQALKGGIDLQMREVSPYLSLLFMLAWLIVTTVFSLSNLEHSRGHLHTSEPR